MQFAINCSAKNFLIHNIKGLADFHQANVILKNLCGLDSFFNNNREFINLFTTLKSNPDDSNDEKRHGYGDFQSPRSLTDSICSFLSKSGVMPEIVIEPTFGTGSFILSTLTYFPNIKRIYGVEIHEPYFWQTKLALLEYYLQHPDLEKPEIYLYHTDIFKYNFQIASKMKNVLVIGNPPWVTNSDLGSIDGVNLPIKRNVKYFKGLDAITGKANFDISEYIILKMLHRFCDSSGWMALLAKNTIIKNLIYDLPNFRFPIRDMMTFPIDAKKYFHASVDAVLFQCNFGSNTQTFTCKISNYSDPQEKIGEFGWVEDKFVSDINAYRTNRKYDGISPFTWRQGVKHDCSKIMELRRTENSYYMNGFHETYELENALLYKLAKSSELQKLIVRKTGRFVIIPQKMIGEDTAYISLKYPLIYQYLVKHQSYFEKRKSRIYKNKPGFSIFGIGDYAFKPYKVAISGMYKKPLFSLVFPENQKPIMLDDTCYYLSFDDMAAAIFTWAILNSKHVKNLLQAITFKSAKRRYTKEILMRINIHLIARDINFKDIITFIKLNAPDLTRHIDQHQLNQYLRSFKLN